MAWDYKKEFVKMKADYNVDIYHRMTNPPIRMRPRPGAKPTMPDGGYHKNDLEPDRDAFGAFQMDGPPIHIVDVKDLDTGEVYLTVTGDDAQQATDRAYELIHVTPKPKTRAQKRVDEGEKAHKSALDLKDQTIADLSRRLDEMAARLLAVEAPNTDTEISPANAGTGLMVAKSRIKG